MADTKADALTEAKPKLKVYYSGETPADSGVSEWYDIRPLDENHRPWLIKAYLIGHEDVCTQFVHARSAYEGLSRGLAEILDAVIVNTKQREALDKLVDRLLYQRLCTDLAHGNDSVI